MTELSNIFVFLAILFVASLLCIYLPFFSYEDNQIKPQQKRRQEKTIKFMLKHIPLSKNILDLGKANNLTALMEDEGYNCINTTFDLDRTPELLSGFSAEIVVGFEILEHLIEPAPVLKAINTRHIVMSVPMPRRFEKLNWQEDEQCQHYHEFHVCQFNKLLRHCSWRIIATELWKSHSSYLGYLVYPQPKYYIVYAEKE